MALEHCRLVALPKIADPRGNLSFVEGGKHIPFAIQRVYYLYGVPENAERGAHGHRALEQIIIPLTGSLDVELDDGVDRRTVRLDDPACGLYVCPMIWRDLRNFSRNVAVLVLASLPYDEADYFRDYQDFMRAVAL